MGCACSNFKRRPSRDGKYSKCSQSQSASFVIQRTYFSSQERSRSRVRSWSPEDAAFLVDEVILENDGSADMSTPDKEVECLSDRGKESEEATRGQNSLDMDISASSDRLQVFLPRLHLLESPPKLCPEQERRLRCVNLEVPLGLIDLSSDESEDANDGFEFARLEASSMSFDSEQRTTEATILGSTPCSPDMRVMAIETCSCKDSKRLSVLEGRVNFCDLLSADSDNTPSPTSVISSRVLHCVPNVPSDSLDESCWQSPLSDNSLYFPGFSIHAPYVFNSGASSSDSLPFRCGNSRDAMGYSPSTEVPSRASLSTDWSPAARPERWDQPSPSCSPFSTWAQSPLSECSIPGAYPAGTIIPGLPNELAQLCLMRLPFIKYNVTYRMVCQQWRAVLSDDEFYKARNALGIQEAHISFVIHGNKVQIFSLHSNAWFCLPPLPHDDQSTSPLCVVSPHWVPSPANYSSPEQPLGLDMEIDPYDWWQIDTVAASRGTLFVIGGGQAEFHCFTQPSKPTSRVHKYDFCRNRWIAVSSMCVARSHAAAVSLGGLIYVAGGSDDMNAGASVEVYDSEQDAWCSIPSMNTPMRMCIGVEHMGCFCVKGESAGPGSLVEGELFDSKSGLWERMRSGMRRGLERGPIATCSSCLFVADWKDSVLKVYCAIEDSWLAVTRLPARISRLIGYANTLYGISGRIKIDPYNHHVISDVPAEIWKLDLGIISQHAFGFDTRSNVGRSSYSQLEIKDMDLEGKYVWECLWRGSKQLLKAGGLAWVPSIAHCILFED